MITTPMIGFLIGLATLVAMGLAAYGAIWLADRFAEPDDEDDMKFEWKTCSCRPGTCIIKRYGSDEGWRCGGHRRPFRRTSVGRKLDLDLSSDRPQRIDLDFTKES